MLLDAADLRFGYRLSRRPRGRTASDAFALDGVDLHIDTGAIVGILGPNGSGKTTLIKLLTGVLGPTSGQIALDGRPLSTFSRAALARRMAVVPQETHLSFDYTVLDIVLMGRYPRLGAFEIEGPRDIASAMDALEATGTRHLAERPFPTLSGGEKQRVIIASALTQLDERDEDLSRANRSALLFLDEPTASLDLHYQVEMATLIRRLHETQDMAIVLSTHDLHFAAAVCTEVVMLREGRVLAQGSVDRVINAAALGELYDVDRERVASWTGLR